MKYSWMIVCCLFLCGCEEVKQRRAERDKATISTSFYLMTVLHDEHLFIMASHGNFMHHPNCPCVKKQLTEKPDNSIPTPPPPIIFELIKP